MSTKVISQEDIKAVRNQIDLWDSQVISSVSKVWKILRKITKLLSLQISGRMFASAQMRDVDPTARMESFRALKCPLRVLDFRMRKFSNLESFRALRLSDLESFRVRKSSIRVLRF